MTSEMTIRTWKDPVFRATLGPEELTALPQNPAGLVELTDEELRETTGGTTLFCAALAAGAAVGWAVDKIVNELY